MAKRDRSRSSGRTSEWIARCVVRFGRYPDNRPQGLKIDANGAIQVSSLIDTWGKSHGINQEQLLAAIQRHMFDERRPTGNLRFSIDSDAYGNMLVRVQPKRGHAKTGAGEKTGPHATPACARWRSQATSAAVSSEANGDQKWEEQSWQAVSTENKGGQTWEDGNWSRNGHAWDDWNKASNNKQSNEADSKSARGGANRWSEVAKDANKDKRGVQVQKWLGWALKSGHRELDISLKDGGARVSDLADALANKRPQFGVTDEDSLERLLNETDNDGRFEIDSRGRLRKVPRADRRPRALKRRSPESADRRCDSEVERSGRSRSPGRRSSESRDRSSPSEADHRSSTPERRRSRDRSWRTDKSWSPSLQASRDDMADTSCGPPKPPPGDYWQKYEDKDNTQIWWYYEGPKGKWWCVDKERENVQRYSEGSGAEGALADGERD